MGKETWKPGDPPLTGSPHIKILSWEESDKKRDKRIKRDKKSKVSPFNVFEDIHNEE